jgi:RNA polymerase sigma-70 factor, ECF subfamily
MYAAYVHHLKPVAPAAPVPPVAPAAAIAAAPPPPPWPRCVPRLCWPGDVKAPARSAQQQARDAELAQWLAEAAAGDSAAFEKFFDATAGLARSVARRVLRGDDIDDLLADAYFEAWRNLSRFDATRGSAITWLLTLVRSRALDMRRRQVTHPSVGGADDSAAELPTSAAADPAEQLWRQQAGSRLHQALAHLSAPERWVLGLAYFRDLTHSQIGQTTGMPLGTVKSHLQRAQAKLRESLAHSHALT